MNITFAPRGRLQIDDARIIWRNFSGEGDKFNREGDRHFTLVIDNVEDAEKLQAEGWNVKIKPPRDEDEEPFCTLKVKVKFNNNGPVVYLQSGNVRNTLDEESIGCLDSVDILSVDLDIRPYDWEVNGKEGRTAYLQSMLVIQEVDRFAERYMD